MPDPLYKRASVQETIVVSLAVGVTITIQVFGSGDDYAQPYTEFGSDETLMLAGAVRASDNASLMGVGIEITVDSVPRGSAPLYGFDGQYNYYQMSIGVLPEGSHLIEAVFPRVRR